MYGATDVADMNFMHINRLVDALRPDGEIWSGDTSHLGFFSRRAIHCVRTIRLVVRGYLEDRCNLHAGALTYYTMMAIVPILALGLALARDFGGGELAHAKVNSMIAKFGEQLVAGASNGVAATPEAIEASQNFIAQFTEYSDSIFESLSNISFGTLGGIGLILLFWVAVSTLNQVEQSFNIVWGAPPRPIARKVTDYIAAILVVPFLIIAASTIPAVATVTNFIADDATGFFSSQLAAKLVRLAATWLLSVLTFLVILMFVPNTRVNFKAGLAGAIISSILFFAWFKICVALQVGVVRCSKLYGGFATLPILLAWMYYSWQILLFGAEFSFAAQYSSTYFRDEGARNASFIAKCRAALDLAAEMARRSLSGLEPVSLGRYVKATGVSGRLMDFIANDLVSCGIAVETADKHDKGLVLIRPPDKITVGEILKSLASHGTAPESLGLGKSDGPVSCCLATLDRNLSMDTALSTICNATED